MRHTDDKGIALVFVIILLLCGMVITYAVFLRNLSFIKVVTADRKSKTAAYYANNAMIDLMRQFSQRQYEDHYSQSALDRSEEAFEGGFSEVTIIPDNVDHTLYIQASGKFGNTLSDPDSTRRLTAVIKFISDFTAYGSYIDGYFNTSGDDAVYDGPTWWNGDWDISGDNCVCLGDVFVKGDIDTPSGGDCTIWGNLYYGGSKGDYITVMGNTYNYFPLGSYPNQVDTEYYKAHYDKKYDSSDEVSDEDGPESPGSYVRLTFNSDGTITETTTAGSSTYSIPADGIIIYGDGCQIRVSGTVHGRATVVAERIKVRNYLNYANGTDHASEDDSFAAISEKEIYYISQTGDMKVHGAFYQEDTSNSELDTDYDDFDLYGTRNRGHHVAQVGDWQLHYDPYLNEYPPPGLPEKAKIVNWRLK